MNATILQLLTAAANEFGIDPNLLIAQAEQESGGNQYDKNGNVLTSPAGAMGVMQLEPGTAAGLGVDPTDASDNITGGAQYMSQLLNEFCGNTALALAAYDWGPGNVSKNGFNNWPTETQNYVSSILGKVGCAIDPTSPTGVCAATSCAGSCNLGMAVALVLVVGLVLFGARIL
jgi:soluble lytic murein transglycosylase-like protein